MKHLIFILFLSQAVIVYAQKTASDFGITEFSINGIYGTIYEKSIYQEPTSIVVAMPYETDFTALSPIVKTTEGCKIFPAQDSIINFDDQNNYVRYTVTNSKGVEKKYDVYISLTTESEPRILSFTFDINQKRISPYARTFLDQVLYLKVPEGTDISHLKPNIIISNNTMIYPPLNSIQDFSKNIKYKLKHYDGTERETEICVSDIDIKIDHLSSDIISAGDTVILYGHFAPDNNWVTLEYPYNYYDVWTKKKPQLTIVSQSDSIIQIVMPNDVYQDKHFFQVTYKGAEDTHTVMVLNPQRPIITGLNKKTIRLEKDKLIIKGLNFQSINKAYLVNPNDGNLLEYEAMPNTEGTELVLKETSIPNKNNNYKSGKYILSLTNEYTSSIDDVVIEIFSSK